MEHEQDKVGTKTEQWFQEEVQNKEEDLTAETELMFICCGWFMGEGARAPMGAWDICAFCIAIGLNWLIPVRADTHTQLFTCLLYLGVVI